MPRPTVLSTALDVAPSRRWRLSLPTRSNTRGRDTALEVQDPELKLPPLASLVIVLLTSTLLQVRPLHVHRATNYLILMFS